MLRLISLTLVLLAVILSARKLIIKKNQISAPKFGSYLSCQGHPYDLKVRFKSFVYLVKGALPKEEDKIKKLTYGASYYQNLYSFMNASEFQSASIIKWIDLTNAEPKISIFKKEEVPYPFDISMDEIKDISGFPLVSKEYIEKLIEIKTIKKGTPAIKVSYEYEGNIYTCLNEDKVSSLKTFSFYQPTDPFVSYFMVPKEERVILKNSARNTQALVNPCINTQGITNNSFQPLGLWYFWKPFHKAGEDLDCSKYYRVGDTISEIKPAIEENVPKKVTDLDFSKFDFKDRPITMSILLGANENYQFLPIKTEKFKFLLNSFLSRMSDENIVIEINKHRNDFDGRVFSLLFFLKSLKEHFEIKKIEHDISDYSLQLTIKGQLHYSRKDIELNISLQPNHPDSPGKAQFDEFFSKSFLNSDIFTYLGHVNGGRIFKSALEEQKLNIIQNQRRDLSYQIFGLFSCSSGYFFNFNDFPKPDSLNFERDIIMSASSFTDFGLPPILALIAQIDGYFYNQTTIPFFTWSKFANSDNFFVLYNDKK